MEILGDHGWQGGEQGHHIVATGDEPAKKE